MIADLDPVIIVELASEAAIHRYVENFVLPTHPHPLQPPETGMTIIIVKLQLSVCICVSVCPSTLCQYCLPLIGATEWESRRKNCNMAKHDHEKEQQRKSQDRCRFQRGGTRRLLRKHDV